MVRNPSLEASIFLSYLRNSAHFIEPNLLYSSSHQLVSGRCPQSDESNLTPKIFLQNNFNTTLHPFIGLRCGLKPSGFPIEMFSFQALPNASTIYVFFTRTF
jgi:hypothetical protein